MVRAALDSNPDLALIKLIGHGSTRLSIIFTGHHPSHVLAQHYGGLPCYCFGSHVLSHVLVCFDYTTRCEIGRASCRERV